MGELLAPGKTFKIIFMEKNELIRLYDKQANQYDKLRRRKKTFDQKWRKQLLSFAKGKILEVSVGAGANFKFYPAEVEVIAVDISAEMLDKAKDAARDSRVKATFINTAVENLHFESESFDTIVSTLSLCAYHDPVHVLKLFESDGVFVCTPEYAFGVPGTLKNALDWTVSSGELTYKPVALITAASVGKNAHAALLLILSALAAKVTEEATLVIPFIRAKLNDKGEIKDEETVKAVKKVIHAFLKNLETTEKVDLNNLR